MPNVDFFSFCNEKLGKQLWVFILLHKICQLLKRFAGTFRQAQTLILGGVKKILRDQILNWCNKLGMLEIASNSGTRLSFSGNCIQKYWKVVGHVQNIYVVISKKSWC